MGHPALLLQPALFRPVGTEAGRVTAEPIREDRRAATLSGGGPPWIGRPQKVAQLSDAAAPLTVILSFEVEMTGSGATGET